MATQHSYGKIITNGLVMYLNAADQNSYPRSGTAWNDISGNTNNGTLVNGPTFNSGNGGSIVFDGVDDYGSISDTSLLNPSNLTVSVWFKLINTFGGSTTSGTIIAKHSSGGGSFNGWILYASLIAIGISLKNNSTNYGFGGLTVNTQNWTNFTLSYVNNSQAFAYYNGVQYASQNIPTINVATQPIRMAISLDTFWARSNVNIAQTLIYNRALSAAEILQNYNATKTRFGLT
jgi:hypothetical protein